MPSIGRPSACQIGRSVKIPGFGVLPSSILRMALCDRPVERTRPSHVMPRASLAARRYIARVSVPSGSRQLGGGNSGIGSIVTFQSSRYY